MIEIETIRKMDDKKHIAILDTSSISFLQGLTIKGLHSEDILRDYDLILIPEWVLNEINDAKGRAYYIQSLIEKGYPIYCIKEESYSSLTNGEEGNLYQIVIASTRQLAKVRSYLRCYVEKADPLDMDAYKDWIKKLSETKTLTIYSQDGDTYEFQRKAEADLKKMFMKKTPVPVSFKSNDAILCQLVREGKINIHDLDYFRTDNRKITYSKEQDDHSIVLITELVNNDFFSKLVADKTVHIIF